MPKILLWIRTFRVPPLTSFFMMRQTIEKLRKETETTLRVFYALRQFRYLLTCQDDVSKLNENPYFWMLFESSLQTNMFIGIRRLYESKPDTFNFQRFIDECLKNLSSFQSNELRKRKCAASPNAHEWIDDYMEGVYEPTAEDFRRLAKVVRENSKNMKGAYAQAANKIYAHAVHMDYAEMATISDKLNFDEIERALSSIWHAYEQVWQMFENGRKPEFQVRNYPYAQEVAEAVTKQVREK